MKKLFFTLLFPLLLFSVKAQLVADFTWCPQYDSSAQACCIQFQDQSVITGGSISTWSYSFGDGLESTVPNPIHCYVVIGTYIITLIVQDNMGNMDTVYHPISITSMDTTGCNCDSLIGIKEPGSVIPVIRVFPNPFHVSAMLDVEMAKEAVSRLIIFDALGSEVREHSLALMNPAIIPREELPSGLYFFEIVSRNGSRLGMGKFIVE